jgi:imidazolonepropionase-like amidohydrolase
MKPTAVEVGDAGEASAGTKRLIDDGVDAIKVFASAPSGASLSQEVMAAVATEAHRAGKLVFVHPNNRADVLNAARAGVDIIAHTTPNGDPWDGALIAAMKEGQVALIPTMKIFTEFLRHDRASARQKVVDAEVAQLRAWVAVGGTVLFGTDVSYVNYDPAQEYTLMAAAGMSFRQILTALTTAPAAKFGEAQRLGRIASGQTADLVVLEEDPARSIRALANVRYVIRDGKVIYRKPK